jgi:hypothetical protein
MFLLALVSGFEEVKILKKIPGEKSVFLNPIAGVVIHLKGGSR